MKTSYDCYLLACREAGLAPISFRRFSIAYGKYQHEFRRGLDTPVDELSAKKRWRIVASWTPLARLVERGRELAELVRRDDAGEDEPGTAGAGDREPRSPRVPVLAGAAARPLPSDDLLKETYAWRL